MVNDAVRLTLAEDAEDLNDAELRQSEESIIFESFVRGPEVVARYNVTIKASAAKELRAISNIAILSRIIERIKGLATLISLISSRLVTEATSTDRQTF
jgi:hypothetical protein